jgi:hypothetical protein
MSPFAANSGGHVTVDNYSDRNLTANEAAYGRQNSFYEELLAVWTRYVRQIEWYDNQGKPADSTAWNKHDLTPMSWASGDGPHINLFNTFISPKH